MTHGTTTTVTTTTPLPQQLPHADEEAPVGPLVAGVTGGVDEEVDAVLKPIHHVYHDAHPYQFVARRTHDQVVYGDGDDAHHEEEHQAEDQSRRPQALTTSPPHQLLWPVGRAVKGESRVGSSFTDFKGSFVLGELEYTWALSNTIKLILYLYTQVVCFLAEFGVASRPPVQPRQTLHIMGFSPAKLMGLAYTN